MNVNGHCLINNNIAIPKKTINLYISYILNPWLRNLNTDFSLQNCLFGSVQYILNPWLRHLNTHFTLKNYLFGSVKLTKNADPDKYKYGGCGKGFDSR